MWKKITKIATTDENFHYEVTCEDCPETPMIQSFLNSQEDEARRVMKKHRTTNPGHDVTLYVEHNDSTYNAPFKWRDFLQK